MSIICAHFTLRKVNTRDPKGKKSVSRAARFPQSPVVVSSEESDILTRTDDANKRNKASDTQ